MHLSESQARRLGLVPPKPQRTTRKEASGPYHTRCTCGEEITTQAAEDRHVAPGHNRFELVL